MKNILKNLFPLAFLLLVTNLASAQDHSMHMQHTMAQKNKNIFLVMMDTMMTGMDNAPKGRSADEDFLQQMLPHHEGAVAMARYEIAHGKNFEMIQLAKSILAEQQSEIATMQIWLKRPQLDKSPLNTEFTAAMNKSMAVMMDNMPKNESLTNTDQAFASVMLPHHQAAITMAKAVLNYGKDQQILAFAKMLISNEQIEIQQMSIYIK